MNKKKFKQIGSKHKKIRSQKARKYLKKHLPSENHSEVGDDTLLMEIIKQPVDIESEQ